VAIRERLDTLSRGELVGLIVVLVATIGGAGLWYSRSLPKPVTIAEAPGGAVAETAPADGAPDAGAGTMSPSAADPASPTGSVIVDVTGQVRRPGVYELPAGARVIDAIQRAGGPKENAELSVLNLAAPLADGQQVVVPKPGQVVPPGVVPTAPVPGAAPGLAPGAPGSGALINVNTADALTLEDLPGIGPVLSQTIVQHRTEHGPFTSVDQLEDVSGIGPATLEKLRPLVTV
jgi:competence protein ComEA